MSSDAGRSSYIPPEGRARVQIDGMLEAAGWAVQDAKAVNNLAASLGVAVREFVMKRSHGPADCLMFLDGLAAGVVEAKKEGETLTRVEERQWLAEPHDEFTVLPNEAEEVTPKVVTSVNTE